MIVFFSSNKFLGIRRSQKLAGIVARSLTKMREKRPQFSIQSEIRGGLEFVERTRCSQNLVGLLRDRFEECAEFNVVSEQTCYSLASLGNLYKNGCFFLYSRALNLDRFLWTGFFSRPYFSTGEQNRNK